MDVAIATVDTQVEDRWIRRAFFRPNNVIDTRKETVPWLYVDVVQAYIFRDAKNLPTDDRRNMRRALFRRSILPGRVVWARF